MGLIPTSSTSSAPSGAAGGDLAGTYPNPQVVTCENGHAIADKTTLTGQVFAANVTGGSGSATGQQGTVQIGGVSATNGNPTVTLTNTTDGTSASFSKINADRSGLDVAFSGQAFKPASDGVQTLGELTSPKRWGTLYTKGGVATSAIASGALPTVSPVSGTAFQCSTARDVFLNVPVTYTPTAGAAATCKVQISPDNVTFSDLGAGTPETVPAGVALDSFVTSVRILVPAGWYVKLTVTNATLGTGTYY